MDLIMKFRIPDSEFCKGCPFVIPYGCTCPKLVSSSMYMLKLKKDDQGRQLKHERCQEKIRHLKAYIAAKEKESGQTSLFDKMEENKNVQQKTEIET